MEPAAASGEESDASGEGELRPPGGLLRHPKYAEMMALDIGQSTQVYAAFLVFLDLLEARNWRDVTYKGSKELQLVYLQGCPGEQENEKVVVPLPVHMSLSHERATNPGRASGLFQCRMQFLTSASHMIISCKCLLQIFITGNN
ncbi:tRNA-splicing endonuclease subunit Sen15 isoform X2 [Mobula birostris]|uniref:tRNA-splicing endonuclease subunit Sen15 isoform X2 n=1 Tax=Mobula birostris TaxID=1983395 RepID=UPI003B27C6C5